MTVLHRHQNMPTWYLRCDVCRQHTWHEDAAQNPQAPHICSDCERTSGQVDSGLAHERVTGARWMYRRDMPAADEAPDQAPIHVWPASGGASLVLSLPAFNARFIVDYRFALERYNRSGHEPPPPS